MIRKRRGHSIAFDHVNEIFVGLFKRIVQRGYPTDAVLHRISRNLSFLKDNWEGMQSACRQSSFSSTKKKKAFFTELELVIKFFQDEDILAFKDREMRTVVGDLKITEAKLNKLHGNLNQRVN